jgi:DNA-binding NtrC family response regulator
VTPVQPKAVLFLDDEKSYVELMTQLLSDHLDCPVLGYTRPKDALADLPRLNVGMIVTDYSMPVMNGIEFIRHAHAACPEAGAVMITGHQIELAGTDFTQIPGLCETLFKPVTWRLLAQRIIKHWPDGNPPVLRENANSV